MSNILLTGGRAPSCLELARNFARQGHRVFIAESQAAHLCRTSRAVVKTFTVCTPRQNPRGFFSDLVNIISTEKIDLLIPTCEEVFYIAPFRDQFPSSCRVFVDEMDKIESLHNKWTFNQIAKSQGLTVPESYLVHDAAELSGLALRDFVLKPAFSRFGSQVLFVKAGEQWPKNMDVSNARPWVLQELVRGQEYCTYSVAQDGKLLVHAVYKHDFVAGKAGISFESIDHQAIQKWIEKFVELNHFTGQIAFDFIEDSAGVVRALECNPRATSGIHLLGVSDRLAQAFLNSSNYKNAPQDSVASSTRLPTVLKAHPNAIAMVGLGMLSFGLPSLRSVFDLWNWSRIFFGGREVVFSWRDPLPFFDQFICFFSLIWQSKVRKIEVLELTTFDIEWNGEKIPT